MMQPLVAFRKDIAAVRRLLATARKRIEHWPEDAPLKLDLERLEMKLAHVLKTTANPARIKT